MKPSAFNCCVGLTCITRFLTQPSKRLFFPFSAEQARWKRELASSLFHPSVKSGDILITEDYPTLFLDRSSRKPGDSYYLSVRARLNSTKPMSSSQERTP